MEGPVTKKELRDIANMLRSAVSAGCEYLDHRKVDYHKIGEECPVVRRYLDAAEKVEREAL